MKKAILFLSFLMTSILANAANQTWEKLKPYILESKKLSTFDGSIFLADSFYISGEKLEINAKDTIPYILYENFFNTFKFQSQYYSEDCEGFHSMSSGDLPNAGREETDRWFEHPYYVPLAYRIVNKGIYEFILFSVTEQGTMISCLYFDESADKLLSDVLLFAGNSIELEDWKNLNDYHKFQNDYDCHTQKIENDVFYQDYTIECEPYDAPCIGHPVFRMVKYNSSLRGYEVIWMGSDTYVQTLGDSSLVQRPMTFRCEINDPDGYTNVREKPNTSSNVLYKIVDGEQFIVSNRMCGDWYRIISFGKRNNGWIHRSRVNKKSMAPEFLHNEYKIKDYKKNGEYFWVYDVDD